MSPSSREMINGARPAPLKIHKDSHAIHKTSSSSSSSCVTAAASAGQQQPQQTPRGQPHQPVIIYTHSPKIIHTSAHDFMALVQKLTGLSRSEADADGPARQTDTAAACGGIDKVIAVAGLQEAGESSEEDQGFGDIQVSCTSISPVAFDPPPVNSFVSEPPMFAGPNASEYFCSSGSLFRCPETSVFSPGIPNISGGSISPSFFDVMKAIHDF